MKKSIFRKSAGDVIRSVLVPIVFTVVVMGMILFGLRQTEQSSRSEGLRVLEDSIRRAVVISYAVEGQYPESIAYIEKNYGIHVDRAKYVVHYSIFASNIMPDITVIEVAGNQ
ncbi:MAG: hypothetical protein FWH33_03415 [Oscillospiraceae bacterium]|nr:hypothetical protein [Oscillospiraceae bacterium]